MKEELKKIWNEAYWQEKFECIELAYRALLTDCGIPSVPIKGNPRPTEHRIEQAVRELCRKMGEANFHIGLTSSDIEANVHVWRLKDSYEVLNAKLETVWRGMNDFFVKQHGEKWLTAYTHLVEAGKIKLEDLFFPDITSIARIHKPDFVFRGIRGSLGIRHAQKYLGINEVALDKMFPHSQIYATQTHDHIVDMQMADWLIAHSAILARVANNIRQLVAFGHLRTKKGDIASTALAHKPTPNIWRMERVSGMAESVYPLGSVVARVASSCLLSRTLTDQSVLRESMKSAVFVFVGMLEDMIAGTQQLEFVDKPIDETIANAEFKLIDLVREGKNREEAYKITKERYGEK